MTDIGLTAYDSLGQRFFKLHSMMSSYDKGVEKGTRGQRFSEELSRSLLRRRRVRVKEVTYTSAARVVGTL